MHTAKAEAPIPWRRLLEEVRAALAPRREGTVMHGGDPYEDDLEPESPVLAAIQHA